MPRLAADQRRKAFLEATVRVIARHGVEGATTRRIAAEAGLQLSALHYTFPSKETLLFAIWEEQVSVLRERMLRNVRRDGLGKAAASLLRQMMTWFQADEDFARVQLELLFWALRQEGELGARAYDIHGAVIEDVLRRSRQGREDIAMVRPMATLVLALADGINVQWFSYRSAERLERDIQLGEAALRALAANATRFVDPALIAVPEPSN
jgi:AcrR family transcriptional regulator